MFAFSFEHKDKTKQNKKNLEQFFLTKFFHKWGYHKIQFWIYYFYVWSFLEDNLSTFDNNSDTLMVYLHVLELIFTFF